MYTSGVCSANIKALQNRQRHVQITLQHVKENGITIVKWIKVIRNPFRRRVLLSTMFCVRVATLLQDGKNCVWYNGETRMYSP
jgi:hypothetical protein